MDTETGGTTAAKGSWSSPVIKAAVLGSLLAASGLLGTLVTLHLAGHLGGSQGSGSEKMSSAEAMVSGASARKKVSQVTPTPDNTAGKVMAAAALASSDLSSETLTEAFQDVASTVEDLMDKATELSDPADLPVMDSADMAGGMGDLSDAIGAVSEGIEPAFGEVGESLEDLSASSSSSSSMEMGGGGGDVSDSVEGLGKLGAGFVGDSSESLEGLGGDAFSSSFGDSMGDLGDGLGDLGDGLGPGLLMSSMINNRNSNNNNNNNRSGQRGQRQPPSQNVNPFGVLLFTDGSDFKKR